MCLYVLITKYNCTYLSYDAFIEGLCFRIYPLTIPSSKELIFVNFLHDLTKLLIFRLKTDKKTITVDFSDKEKVKNR